MIIVYKQNEQLQIIKFQDRFRWASFMSIGCQCKRQKDDKIECYNKKYEHFKRKFSCGLKHLCYWLSINFRYVFSNILKVVTYFL